MVAKVVRDLQGMATLAGEKLADAAVTNGKADREYLVGSTKRVIAPSCWDPASYLLPMESWKPVAPNTAGAVPDLLHDLLPELLTLFKVTATV